MIKILLSGCNGKMGQVISRLAQQFSNLKIVAGYDLVDTQKMNILYIPTLKIAILLLMLLLIF